MKKLQIGIAGLGTVGSALVELISKSNHKLRGHEIVINGVSAKNKNKKRSQTIKKLPYFNNPIELAKSEQIDIFVELMGCENGASLKSVKAALNCGKHVVTANKALLAKHGFELAAMAEKKGLAIFYEASVGGCVPIIRTMRQSLGGDNINRVLGILNGTCNYILTNMEQQNMPFEKTLLEAQKLGYAEADPTFDIDGFDTAHKITILARLAFGEKIEKKSLSIEGIRHISLQDIAAAKELGFRIKLLGIAERIDKKIDVRVHPTLVPLNCAIAKINDVINMGWLETDYAGTIMLSGAGAGGAATASAVAGDICELACITNNSMPIFSRPIANFKPHNKQDVNKRQSEFFIHMNVPDKSGMMAKISTCMARQDISLESIMQRQVESKKNIKPITLITHLCSQQAISRALKDMKEKKCFIGRAQMLRIEKPESK